MRLPLSALVQAIKLAQKKASEIIEIKNQIQGNNELTQEIFKQQKAKLHTIDNDIDSFNQQLQNIKRQTEQNKQTIIDNQSIIDNYSIEIVKKRNENKAITEKENNYPAQIASAEVSIQKLTSDREKVYKIVLELEQQLKQQKA